MAISISSAFASTMSTFTVSRFTAFSTALTCSGLTSGA